MAHTGAPGDVASEIASLEAEVTKGGASASVCQRFLRLTRDAQVRRPHAVVKASETVLGGRHAKGDDMWVVLEQAAVAAMDCGSLALAEQCVSRLSKQFPKSARAGKLRGMLLESTGDYKGALDVYDEILEEVPTEQRVRKRRAALFRARGAIELAVKELCEYLDTFMSDADAWMELSEMYLMRGAFKRAAFCLEEVLLLHPQNGAVHVRLAEALYSSGGAEAVAAARRHFSAAVDLSGGADTRALAGLAACAAAQARGEKKGRPEEAGELYALAGAHLVNRYEQLCPALEPHARAMVEAKAR